MTHDTRAGRRSTPDPSVLGVVPTVHPGVSAVPTRPRGPFAAIPADLAQTRERFLTAEPTGSNGVRPAILASWQRSRDLNVAADRIQLPYLRDPDVDTELTRSAEDVVRRLRDQLDGQAVSIILTDPSGLVLSRRTADAQLDRHLDSVLLAPGFSYNEQFVGTNGIGTALEAGTATQVFGHEHYAEGLEDLACAGVPIHHPISGRTLGAIDLTCWRKDAESLLLTLARATAEQIEQALLSDSGLHELELLQAYRRTCRRIAGIVFALTSDAVMLNDHARALLDPLDQAALLAQASEASQDPAHGARWSGALRLPTGTSARLYYNRVLVGPQPAGVVVHVKLGEAETVAKAGRDAATRPPLPGVVGLAPLWLRACQGVETAFRSGEWLAVDGEPGVGKLAVLRAVQLRRQPTLRFAVLSAADARTDPGWLSQLRATVTDGADSVVIRHVDQLDPPRLRSLAATLAWAREQPRTQPLWVAITLARPVDGGRAETELGRLLRQFPVSISVPPLRLRLEDLPALVTFLLARIGPGGQISCSPEATRLLMRASWPGNVEQLRQVLHGVVAHRRSGVIGPADLPPETRSVSRRVLSPLEALERDAIVAALGDAGGNKMRAAGSLGMSRATIYRKIHEYGIVVPGG